MKKKNVIYVVFLFFIVFNPIARADEIEIGGQDIQNKIGKDFEKADNAKKAYDKSQKKLAFLALKKKCQEKHKSSLGKDFDTKFSTFMYKKYGVDRAKKLAQSKDPVFDKELKHFLDSYSEDNHPLMQKCYREILVNTKTEKLDPEVVDLIKDRIDQKTAKTNAGEK